MRILIEAHHPMDIHFWKFPVRELIKNGHRVLLVGRDRDVMVDLLQAYHWIPFEVPPRKTRNNKFPLVEMLSRQWHLSRHIISFEPDVVASMMGSYTQTAKLLGCRNVIFTDSEHQGFNHRIAHPFADEIHTSYCFYKDLGNKQRSFRGILELAFLDPRHFIPDGEILKQLPGFLPREYILIRLSAWNTLHDINKSGIGPGLGEFINAFKDDYKIVISAEEGNLPSGYEQYAASFHPAHFHDILAQARFVLSEGGSTAAEAACLGVPTVYINSIQPMGYLKMLEHDYGLLRCFQSPEEGLPYALEWAGSLDDSSLGKFSVSKNRMLDDHCDVTEYVVNTLLGRN